MNAQAIRLGTIVVDVSFASRYGFRNATQYRVTRMLEGGRAEVEYDEFGESCTDIVHLDEVAPLTDFISTYELIIELLARHAVPDVELLRAAGVTNVDELIAWAQRRDSGRS